MRNFQEAFKMLDAAAATGSGYAMDVASFRDLELAITSSGNASFTLKIQGSLQTAPPTWGSASSPTNQWSYLQTIDLADQSAVNGATGIAATGSDISRQLEINVNGQRWINVIITAYSAGAVTVLAMPFNSGE